MNFTWDVIYFSAKCGCAVLIIYAVVKAAHAIISAVEHMPGITRMRDRWKDNEDE